MLLAFAGAVRGDEQSDGVALIDKAIKATGGDANWAKAGAFVGKGHGKVEKDGKEDASFTGKMSAQGLDRLAIRMEVNERGRQAKVAVVFNGDKRWIQHEQETREAPDEVVRAVRAAFIAGRLPQLLPLLKDKSVHLAPLGEMQVENKPAVGVKITHPTYGEANLYLDKTTSLPVKVESRIKDPNGQEMALAFFYGDYKDAGGVQHPMKVKGKFGDNITLDIDISDAKAHSKLDDTVFAKP